VNNRDEYDDLHTTYHALYEINPIHDVRIRLNGYNAKAARLALSNEDLAVAGKPQTIVVPKVELHEVVLVEPG
jgi:hypothetical protein